MANRASTVERRAALFREATAIIEQDPRKVELDSVAAQIATSRRQLQRAFAEAGETTFRTYLLNVRMRQARELLREGRMPVRLVAHRVGYRQPGQFTKAFRRHYGVLPSQLPVSDGNGNQDRSAVASPATDPSPSTALRVAVGKGERRNEL